MILIFLAVTWLQSGFDKASDWKTNVEWLQGHFSNTFLRNQVPGALGLILMMELISGVLCLVGIMEILRHGGSSFGYYGAVSSCLTFTMLLLGQRLAKDYDGARTICIYFIPAVLAVHWLG